MQYVRNARQPDLAASFRSPYAPRPVVLLIRQVLRTSLQHEVGVGKIVAWVIVTENCTID
jgi:hypothetical protein